MSKLGSRESRWSNLFKMKILALEHRSLPAQGMYFPGSSSNTKTEAMSGWVGADWCRVTGHLEKLRRRCGAWLGHLEMNTDETESLWGCYGD